MYFEAVISFWEDDIQEDSGEDIRRHVRKHVLCKAINYTDAEAMATQHGVEITSESIDIGPIREMKLWNYYPLTGMVDDNFVPWFKCVGEYSDVNEKGKRKKYKMTFLVQASDSREASISAKEIMKKETGQDDCEILRVTKTKISEVLEDEQSPL